MNSIEIVATGKYVPSTIVSNNELEKNNNLDDGYIYKRTGIENRHYIENETLEDIAILSVKDMLSKNDNVNIDNIGLIITASTTFDNIMPSLSFSIQNYFNIKDCMCLDVLAGCSGFINALDIAQKYVSSSQIEYALIVGAEVLSKNNYKSINDEMLFGDGAGCILIKSCKQEKMYFSCIESMGENNNILTCDDKHNLYMDGKNVYKFATTKTVENINKILKLANLNSQDIDFTIPHQSNVRILDKIASKTGVKMYSNIRQYANTFCASIPIAIDDLFYSNKIKSKDKILLLGYGGGLNLGSILMEV